MTPPSELADPTAASGTRPAGSTVRLTHVAVELALHRLREGHGRPLLVLHGLGEHTPAEAPRHLAAWPGPIWGLDFTGHGESTLPAGGGWPPAPGPACRAASCRSARRENRAGPAHAVTVSSGILFLYCVGAILAPVVASTLMAHYGAAALFVQNAVTHAGLAGFALWRVAVRERGAVLRREPLLSEIEPGRG